MSAELLVERFRRFLLSLAGLLCAATIVELALIKHVGDPIQWIPFVLCGLGVIVIGWVLYRPQRNTLRVMQGVMGLLVVGTLLGIYEHIESNLEVVRETQAHAATSTFILKTLGGAAPLLAPGMLAFAAILALAATYYHPALATKTIQKR